MAAPAETPFAQLIAEKRASNQAKIPNEWRLTEACGIPASDISGSRTR
jgi:hypothetical protein